MKVLNEEYAVVAPAALTEHPKNPRRGDTAAIRDSIDTNGFYGAVIAQKSTGHILAGNHRHRVAVAAGADTIPVLWVDVDDDTALRILLADNRTADLAAWDDATLADLLRSFQTYEGTGFTPDAVTDFLASLEDDSGGGDGGSTGDLLNLTDVAMGDPKHEVNRGDIWHVGVHVLCCADLITEWETWTVFLTSGALFVPYPGPYVALSTKAEDHRLVMVQPDPFLAGHLLDKYEAVHGSDGIVRVGS